MEVREYLQNARVGDIIKTNASLGGLHHDEAYRDKVIYINGMVGEINKDIGTFFIWQDVYCGDWGDINPDTKGYSFSWAVLFDNIVAEIELIERIGSNENSDIIVK